MRISAAGTGHPLRLLASLCRSCLCPVSGILLLRLRLLTLFLSTDISPGTRPVHPHAGGRGGRATGIQMRRGPVQPGKLGGSPGVVVKGPPAPPASAPPRSGASKPGLTAMPLGGQELSRTVLRWGDLWPVPAFVPTVRTFPGQNIREGLSVNNGLRQGKTKDSTARGTENGPGRDGAGAGTGMRPQPRGE